MTGATIGYRYTDGTVETNIQIPKSGGGYHPHLTDLYIPTGTINHCLVSLHGATNLNYAKESLAWNMGIRALPRTDPAPPVTASEVIWSRLAQNRVVLMIPSGQACTGVYDAVGNPNSVNSITTNNPYGIFTWTNEYMYSQYDDYNFLLDVASYLNTRWPGTTRNLLGHSNGGMMANKMWYEAPAASFTTYGSTSGPPSDFFVGYAAPSTPKPMWMQFGYLDTTIGIYGDSTTSPVTAGYHWDDTLWQQPYSQRSVSDVNYPNTRSHMNWLTLLQAKLDAFSSGITASESDGVDTTLLAGTSNAGNQRTYTYLSNQLQLVRIDRADHHYATQQKYTQELIFNRYMTFIRTVT